MKAFTQHTWPGENLNGPGAGSGMGSNIGFQTGGSVCHSVRAAVWHFTLPETSKTAGSTGREGEREGDGDGDRSLEVRPSLIFTTG